jgi:hypothetical protein
LLPRSHCGRLPLSIPSGAALRPTENFVGFDFTRQPRVLRLRRRCTSKASENRLKNNMM